MSHLQQRRNVDATLYPQPVAHGRNVRLGLSALARGASNGAGSCRVPVSPGRARRGPPFVGELFVRTELYFGSLKPDNSQVTREEFAGFLREIVTLLFPEGLTLLTGLGQFRNASEETIQERSRLLILLYPVEDRQDKSEKIETIRDRYKSRFVQESVLRVDRCCEQVGF